MIKLKQPYLSEEEFSLLCANYYLKKHSKDTKFLFTVQKIFGDLVADEVMLDSPKETVDYFDNDRRLYFGLEQIAKALINEFDFDINKYIDIQKKFPNLSNKEEVISLLTIAHISTMNYDEFAEFNDVLRDCYGVEIFVDSLDNKEPCYVMQTF